MTIKVTEASEKVTKNDRKSPENKKSDRAPFADLLLRHPEIIHVMILKRVVEGFKILRVLGGLLWLLPKRQGKEDKEAETASCGETVSQKGVLGESVSSLPPLSFSGASRANLMAAEKKRTLQKKTPFSTTVSPHDALSALGF